MGEKYIIKHNLKNQMFSYLATISPVTIEQKTKEEKEELIKWKPVEKLDTSKNLICQTCPYEDLFETINNDIEEMKKTVSKVYALQDKKLYKTKNKVKDIQVDIQENVKKDIKEDKVVVKKEIKEKPVKPKKKEENQQKNKNKKKNKKRRKKTWITKMIGI